MKILSAPAMYNTGINNVKKQNQSLKYNNSGMDTVSFSAKIPEFVQAELQYKELEEKLGRYPSYKFTSNVIELLKQLRYDDSVSPDFKSRILLQDNNYPLCNQIKMSKNDVDDNIHFQTAKAMIEASPNIETTKAQLLTPYDETIPLFNAGAKEAKMLLDASPDEETFKKQIFFTDKRGRNAFMCQNNQTKQTIIDACDYETKRELLLSPKLMFDRDIDIDTVLEFAPDDETKLEMLQINNSYQDNLLHYENADNVKSLLKKYDGHPDILKKLLIQPNISGYIPIATCSKSAAMELLNASPDEETLAKQLTAKNKDHQMIISRVCEQRREDYIKFLEISPDDDTLMTQLFQEERLAGWHGPIVARLSFSDSVAVLNQLKSIPLKKELLNSSWDEWKQELFEWNGKEYKNDFCSRVKESKYYSQDKEQFFNILYEVIKDDTTSNEEAVELIQNYKDCVTPRKKEYLEQIEAYLRPESE